MEPPAVAGDSNEESLDLKKAGVFPLVHGVRCMALEQRLSELGTVARIERLVTAGKLDRRDGRGPDRKSAFLHGPEAQGRSGRTGDEPPVSGGIQVSKLSSLDRDLLKDTLAVVKRFKLLVGQRFHLDMVS